MFGDGVSGRHFCAAWVDGFLVDSGESVEVIRTSGPPCFFYIAIYNLIRYLIQIADSASFFGL